MAEYVWKFCSTTCARWRCWWGGGHVDFVRVTRDGRVWECLGCHRQTHRAPKVLIQTRSEVWRHFFTSQQ